MKLLSFLLLLSIPALAKMPKSAARPACATTYSVVLHDQLGNTTQGASENNLRKLQGELQKKYPDVCYAPPSPAVTTVFYITIIPATYHGTRTVSDMANTSGSVSTSDGEYGTYNGSTTSSHQVPVSFEYGKYVLTVETLDGEKATARHRFLQNGIYHTMYGIPLGGRGHHPALALIEDAVKWVHSGGLEDPLQAVQ